MDSSFCLIVFDDKVYKCIKTTSIKKRNGRDVTVKWKNSLYAARLVCTANETTCRSLLCSIRNKLPYIELKKINKSLENPLFNVQNLSVEEDIKKISKDMELLKDPLIYQGDIQTLQQRLTTPECKTMGSKPSTSKEVNIVIKQNLILRPPSIFQDIIKMIDTKSISQDKTEVFEQQPSTSLVNNTEDVEFEYDSDDSVRDKDYVPASESDDSEDETTSLVSSHEENFNEENFGLLGDNVTGCIDFAATTSQNNNIEAIPISDHEDTTVVDIPPVTRKCYPKKYNICTFCDKKITNIDRHFQQVHKNESQVKSFLHLPKKCPERKKIMGELRKLGNFKYNKSRKEGELFVARTQHKKKINISKYTPCPKCKVFITQASLRRHYRNCEPSRKGQKERNVLIASRAVLEDIHVLANEVLKKKVFPVLQEDAIKDLIRYDDLLILYGNTMCDKYRDEHHFDMIRSRLRTMAKFLSILKSLQNSIDDLKSVFKPEYFNLITRGLHVIGEYDEKTGHFKKATLPSTVGTALKYIGKLYISDCIKNKNEELRKEVEDLMTLLRTDLESTVNKTSSESLLSQKRQKKVVLPDTKDIVKLNNYLQKNRNYYYNDLIENGFSFKSWLQLSKYTLVSILVFNRKRPGELERAYVRDYKNFQKIEKEKNPEIYNSLSEDGKRAAHDYVRFCIRGKLARGVPVLLHINMKSCIDKLLEYRKNAGVLSENPYIFARPQTNGGLHTNFKYIRAGTLMAKYAEECNTRNPLSLRATQLRKHIATKSALLNLDKDKVYCLQNFLGHEEKIHNQIYRQPLEHREIVNVSKLLEIGQGQNEYVEDSTVETPNVTLMVTESTSENSLEDSDLAVLGIVGSDDSEIFSSTIEKEASQRKRYRLLDVDSGCIKRRTWTTPEKDETTKIFSHYIKSNALPSTANCIKLVQNNAILKHRTTQQIRSWIQNHITRKSNIKPVTRRSWESPEREALKQVFCDYIKPNSVEYPSSQEIEEVISKFPELQNRTPTQIKSQIQYQRKLKSS